MAIIQINEQEHPILVDKYIYGQGDLKWTPSATAEDVLIPGIMEHIERAGVHSGDSISRVPGRIAEPPSFSKR